MNSQTKSVLFQPSFGKATPNSFLASPKFYFFFKFFSRKLRVRAKLRVAYILVVKSKLRVAYILVVNSKLRVAYISTMESDLAARYNKVMRLKLRVNDLMKFWP